VWTKLLLQIGFCDIKYSLPGIKALSGKYIHVLGKPQARESLLQVAHMGCLVSAVKRWCTSGGGDGGNESIPIGRWMYEDVIGCGHLSRIAFGIQKQFENSDSVW
jgi:hypothetical protein